MTLARAHNRDTVPLKGQVLISHINKMNTSQRLQWMNLPVTMLTDPGALIYLWKSGSLSSRLTQVACLVACVAGVWKGREREFAPATQATCLGGLLSPPLQSPLSLPYQLYGQGVRVCALVTAKFSRIDLKQWKLVRGISAPLCSGGCLGLSLMKSRVVSK